MQVPTTFIGLDVSKATLEAAVAGQGHTRKIANEAEQIDAWLAELPAGAAVAVESTGRYHQLLVHRALRVAVPVYVLNAKDVWFYAKTLGVRAKTDRLDCQVIAQYLHERHAQLRPCVQTSEVILQIERLLRQRSALVSKRVALREAFRDCPIEQPLAHIEQGMDAAEKALNERIEQLLQADQTLRQTQQLLRTITGFGAQSSALLAILLSRFSFGNSDALVAYVGLDPRANDSGAKRGRRSLSKKGPPELRKAMFLVAFAACHSKALKPTYLALKNRGFKTTEALIILARKLLRVAFAVWKTREPFDLRKLGAAPA
jgi:transposase